MHIYVGQYAYKNDRTYLDTSNGGIFALFTEPCGALKNILGDFLGFFQILRRWLIFYV